MPILSKVKRPKGCEGSREINLDIPGLGLARLSPALSMHLLPSIHPSIHPCQERGRRGQPLSSFPALQQDAARGERWQAEPHLVLWFPQVPPVRQRFTGLRRCDSSPGPRSGTLRSLAGSSGVGSGRRVWAGRSVLRKG